MFTDSNVRDSGINHPVPTNSRIQKSFSSHLKPVATVYSECVGEGWNKVGKGIIWKASVFSPRS